MQQYLFYYKLMIYVETIDCSFCLVIFAYTYVKIIINSKYCSLNKETLTKLTLFLMMLKQLIKFISNLLYLLLKDCFLF